MGVVNYRTAAQAALDCQNGVNAAGISYSMMCARNEILAHPSWQEKGTEWFNHHPIMFLFLFKLMDLQNISIACPSDYYERQEALCKRIAAGEIDAY